MRNTRQREAVLGFLRESRDHPTADMVMAAARRHMPRVSLATIYRLLHALENEGAIRVVPQVGGPTRYDGNPHAHSHAVCEACGLIVDVPELLGPDARREIERWTGFRVLRARLEWRGLCSRCSDDSVGDPDE